MVVFIVVALSSARLSSIFKQVPCVPMVYCLTLSFESIESRHIGIKSLANKMIYPGKGYRG